MVIMLSIIIPSRNGIAVRLKSVWGGVATGFTLNVNHSDKPAARRRDFDPTPALPTPVSQP